MSLTYPTDNKVDFQLVPRHFPPGAVYLEFAGLTPNAGFARLAKRCSMTPMPLCNDGKRPLAMMALGYLV